MRNLKPCPFCGGQADVRKSYGYSEFLVQRNYWYAACRECACEGRWHRSEFGAYRLWNTRVESGGSAHPGSLESDKIEPVYQKALFFMTAPDFDVIGTKGGFGVADKDHPGFDDGFMVAKRVYRAEDVRNYATDRPDVVSGCQDLRVFKPVFLSGELYGSRD